MPGVYHLSVDRLPYAIEEAVNASVTSVLLFGLPETKDPAASEAFADAGIVQQAVRRIKADFPEVVVITDVCLCAYTDHGHCGLLTPTSGRASVSATSLVTAEVNHFVP